MTVRFKKVHPEAVLPAYAHPDGEDNGLDLVAVAVKEELKIPVRFVGVGEGIDDMQAFDPDDYARALLSEE